MFPLPWNKAYRKKDGSLTTIDEAISSGGGGDPYTLPTASAETKGGIKIGSGLTMTGEVLSADDQLPTSTSSDADKVLTVGNDGTPEWATPGGGGSALSYIDVTVSGTIPATSCANAPFHVADYPALVGKTIVCGLVLEATDVYLYCVGFSRFSTPLVSEDWVYAGIYNINAAQALVTKLRIFYM